MRLASRRRPHGRPDADTGRESRGRGQHPRPEVSRHEREMGKTGADVKGEGEIG